MPHTFKTFKFEVEHNNKKKLYCDAYQVCEDIEDLSRTALFKIIKGNYPKQRWTPENIKIKKVNISVNNVVKKKLPKGERNGDEIVMML